MQSTVTWHKYPDEKPAPNTKILAIGQKLSSADNKKKREAQICEAFFRHDRDPEGFYSASGAYLHRVTYWAYMPSIPKLTLDEAMDELVKQAQDLKMGY